MDPTSAAKDKLFDEILQFAESREAEGLKKTYCPEPTQTEAQAEAPAADEDQLDAESLQRLSAMAGE